MAGTAFNINITFGVANGPQYGGTTVVAAPAGGNNPDQIDQIVSAAQAIANPGHGVGDQLVSDNPIDHDNLLGFGLKALLVTAGSGDWEIVVKFLKSDDSTIVSYTLNADNPVVAFADNAQLGGQDVKQIDCTPSVDGAIVELFGTVDMSL